MSEWCRIQEEDFSIEAEVDRLRAASGRIGAIATFLGLARDHSEGRPVEELRFEHYGGMAEKALADLRRRAMERFDLVGLSIVHRVGRVLVGENIVLIAAAAAHRGPAFDACRWTITELKKDVPIWKKEIGPDGESWVTPHP